MALFGLIGYPLSHSFSQRFFSEKFDREDLSEHRYELLPIENLHELPALLRRFPDLKGLNVTIPHKQTVISYLDRLDPTASAVGAVNTIRREPDGTLSGFNTDVIGFQHSLDNWLPENFVGQALVLGTGGASRAVTYVLDLRGIPYRLVSRQAAEGQLGYPDADEALVRAYGLIINTTPLGMSPKIEQKPPISYEGLTPMHYLYDLVYNPAETAFLRAGIMRGAKVRNGLEMLYKQAEAAWEIWTESSGSNY